MEVEKYRKWEQIPSFGFCFVLRFKKRVSLIYSETDVQTLIYKQEPCFNDRMMEEGR